MGNVSGSDADAGDTLTYSLTNDAAGRFVIDGVSGQITVADGSLLNFEVASLHGITVRTTDSSDLIYDESFTIAVNDVNEAPVALDDDVIGEQLEDLVVSAGVITANDFDIDGDSLSVVLVSGPVNGTLVLNVDGFFVYKPNGSFHGQDEFTYLVTDGSLNSPVATVLSLIHI